MIGLHAGKSLGEIVDHVVAPKFSVGHDVEAADFLILDRCFHGDVMDLVEFLPADPARKVLGLQPLQPAWHGITSDNRGG